jgi:hypothetical protein
LIILFSMRVVTGLSTGVLQSPRAQSYVLLERNVDGRWCMQGATLKCTPYSVQKDKPSHDQSLTRALTREVS